MKQHRTCPVCSSEFVKPQNCSVNSWTKRKYCSRVCAQKDKTAPWLISHQIKPGERLSLSTQFKKGMNAGASNNKWKGDKAGYVAKHLWVSHHFGKPQECVHCLTTELRAYHWANVSGEYKRKRDDWLRLCVPCHRRYDYARDKRLTVRKTNTSGYRGVGFAKHADKWRATITVDKKTRHLGYFHTAELAHEAYQRALKTVL